MRLPVVDRYLARELLPPFALGVALFTFFLIIDRLYQLTELVVTKGVPFHLVLQLLVFMLPSFLAHTLPMALLVAVLLAVGRLAGDREVVAFRASGVSPLRLLRPVLGVAVAVGLTTAALTLVLNPLANREFQRQLFRILQSRAVAGIHERVFNDAFGDVIIYVEDVSASQVGLRGLLVSDERDPALTRIITAREGRLLTDEANRRITLRLIDGAVNEADVTAVPGARGQAPSNATVGAASAARYRYTQFGLYDLNLSVTSPFKSAPRFERPEQNLTLPELRQWIARFRDDAHSRRPFELEWHKRFAFPVSAVIFTLVAFPLVIRSLRGGRGLALTASLAILVTYYLALTTLERASLGLRVPAWVAVWAPPLGFGLLGLGLLAAAAREWRPPALPALWRGLARLARRRPGLRVVAPAPPWTPARDSTHLLDRYLVREFLTLAATTLAVVAALAVVVDLAQSLNRFLQEKPPLLYVLEHLVYRVPAAVHDGLPVVMLVATLFLFLALSRHHELTALKAAGVSLYRVAGPILAVGAAVAVGAGLFQELVLPVLNARGEEVDEVKIRGRAPRHLQTRQRLWVRAADSRFYRIALLNPATDDLYGVTILEVDRGFRVTGRLDARRAHWTPAGWELVDGAYREIGPEGLVRTVPITRTAIVLTEVMEDFTSIQKPVGSMSYRELREYIAQLEAAGFQVRKYLVELYAKLSFPLVNLVMVLVAIPLAIQAPRGGRLVGIGLALAIMVAYLVVHFTAIAFARADLLPPLLAAWTANVVFLGIGVSLLLRAPT